MQELMNRSGVQANADLEISVQNFLPIGRFHTLVKVQSKPGGLL